MLGCGHSSVWGGGLQKIKVWQLKLHSMGMMRLFLLSFIPRPICDLHPLSGRARTPAACVAVYVNFKVGHVRLMANQKHSCNVFYMSDAAGE